MEEKKAIAIKNELAGWVYGGMSLLLLIPIVITLFVTLARDYAWVPFIMLVVGLPPFSIYLMAMAIKVERMPSILIAEGEGGIWIMACHPPLFVAYADIKGVRCIRSRVHQFSSTSCPIGITTGKEEIVIHAVEDVDVTHDRLIALMIAHAKDHPPTN